MGLPVLVLGESGTGKSTGLRNFEKDELAIVNVAGKPLPFRDKNFDKLNGTVDFRKIYTFLKTCGKKAIVIDDAQYIMSFQYMRRIKENGWDKFNEIQSDFFNLIDCVKDLPDDTIVYFLSHLETKEDGRQKIKTIGKMLDEKITIEGMFSIVLKTYTADGKYYFLTQNSGNDTVKSPIGLFPAYAIDNDLKYVDEKIRNYYQLGEFLTDDEIADIDKEAAKVDIIKDEVEGKKRRSVRREKSDADTATDGTKESENAGRRRRRVDADNAGDDANASSESTNGDSEISSEGNDENKEKPADNAESGGRRRRRSVSENMAEERAAVDEANADAVTNAGMEEAGDKEEVPFDEVETPELQQPPRRKRRDAESAMNEPETEETTETTPRRRRRRG